MLQQKGRRYYKGVTFLMQYSPHWTWAIHRVLKRFWMDFDQIFWSDGLWQDEQSVKFWWLIRSVTGLGTGSKEQLWISSRMFKIKGLLEISRCRPITNIRLLMFSFREDMHFRFIVEVFHIAHFYITANHWPGLHFCVRWIFWKYTKKEIGCISIKWLEQKTGRWKRSNWC